MYLSKFSLDSIFHLPTNRSAISKQMVIPPIKEDNKGPKRRLTERKNVYWLTLWQAIEAKCRRTMTADAATALQLAGCGWGDSWPSFQIDAFIHSSSKRTTSFPSSPFPSCSSSSFLTLVCVSTNVHHHTAPSNRQQPHSAPMKPST